MQSQVFIPCALRNSLAGTISFSFKNGVYRGIDVNYEVANAISFLRKDPPPRPSKTPETKFDSMTGSFNVHRGLARTTDLLLNSPSMQVTGRGTINAVNEDLNIKLLANILSSSYQEDVNKLQNLLGGGIPIKVSCKLSKPCAHFDKEAVATAIAKGIIKKQADKIIEKHLDKKVGQEIKEKLKDVIDLPF